MAGQRIQYHFFVFRGCDYIAQHALRFRVIHNRLFILEKQYCKQHNIP